MNAAPKRISPFASATGLPCSAVRIVARSSACSTIRSNQRRMIVERSFAGRAAQAGSAAAAASIARRMSSRVALATPPIDSPVPGSVTSKRASSEAADQPPSRKRS